MFECLNCLTDVVKLQEKLEKESESAKADAAGTSSGAAGQSSSSRDEAGSLAPGLVNQDHLRQASLRVLSFSEAFASVPVASDKLGD